MSRIQFIRGNRIASLAENIPLFKRMLSFCAFSFVKNKFFITVRIVIPDIMLLNASKCSEGYILNQVVF